MADEADDDKEELHYIMPDEASFDFQAKLTQLLFDTKDLGMIVHLCLVAQTLGGLCFKNAPNMMDVCEKNLVMNFHHGAQGVMQNLMEESLNKTLN